MLICSASSQVPPRAPIASTFGLCARCEARGTVLQSEVRRECAGRRSTGKIAGCIVFAHMRMCTVCVCVCVCVQE